MDTDSAGCVIVFDYDGVIVDSGDMFARYFIEGCKSIGRDDIATEKDFLDLFDGNMYESMLKKGLSKEDMLKVVFILRDGLLRHQDDLDVVDGIGDVLNLLGDTGAHLLVVTSNATDVVSEFLKKHGLDVFEDIIGSDREPSKSKALAEMNRRFPGKRCWYVGDTCGDVVESRAAGLECVVVGWGFHDRVRLESCDASIVDTPEELQKMFV